MTARLLALAGLVWLGSGVAAAEGERGLRVIPGRGPVVIEWVGVYRLVDGRLQLVAEQSGVDAPIPLPHEGPFRVLVRPKGGLPVIAHDRLTVRPGQTYELKLAEVLGAVEVLGDELPTAEKIVVTDVRDPGPGEKGHVPVQVVTGYRTELLVPPGTYALWVVPANGARAQRVADDVRVQAGRTVRIGD